MDNLEREVKELKARVDFLEQFLNINKPMFGYELKDAKFCSNGSLCYSSLHRSDYSYCPACQP